MLSARAFAFLCGLLLHYGNAYSRVTKPTTHQRAARHNLYSKADRVPDYVDSITPESSPSTTFPLGRFAFSLLPLSPESVGRRKTICKEVVKDQIWTLDQVQGIINVNVPVRCVVVKLKDGGLMVNNPVAPTKETVDFVRDIENRHGKVKYITLSSLGIEHKGTAGAFSSFFPSSSVYYQNGHYSFPLNLPTQLFFPWGKIVKEIPERAADAPWYDDLDHHCLGPLRPKGIGGFAETAFFHRATKTLLVTDAVIRVDDSPPEIINEDPRALLYHARDFQEEIIADSKANRAKGWRRMVLFGLVFMPKGIEIYDTFDAIRRLKDVSNDMKKLGAGAVPYDGGLYPWKWVESELPSFKALQGGLLVAPILRKLILNREPERVLDWVDKVSKWPFQRIIPAHFANDVKATPKDFTDAFSFLLEEEKGLRFGRSKVPAPLEGDMKTLSDASKALTAQNVLFEEARLVNRLQFKQRAIR